LTTPSSRHAPLRRAALWQSVQKCAPLLVFCSACLDVFYRVQQQRFLPQPVQHPPCTNLLLLCFLPPVLQDGPDADAADSGDEAAAGKGSRRGKQRQQQQQPDKGKKGKKGKAGEEPVDAAKQAELEMLLMDDAALLAAVRGGGGGASAPAGNQQQGQGQEAGAKPKLSRKERLRLKKEARRRERQEGSDDEDAAGAWDCSGLVLFWPFGTAAAGVANKLCSALRATCPAAFMCHLFQTALLTHLSLSSSFPLCSRRGRRVPGRGPVRPALWGAAHLAPLCAGPNRPPLQVRRLGWNFGKVLHCCAPPQHLRVGFCA